MSRNGQFMLFVEDDLGDRHALPYAVTSARPVFSWELPEGVVQRSYCLELCSRGEVLLSDGTRGRAYYSSGLVESDSPSHKVVFEMNPGTWAQDGACLAEARLRIYGAEGDCVFSTHDATAIVYPFEPTPQGVAWDSDEDGLLLMVGRTVPVLAGSGSILLEWLNCADPDGDVLSYDIQLSRTPLFGEGAESDPELVEIEDIPALPGLRSSASVSPASGGLWFWRVRAEDSQDSGEWSQPACFHFDANATPVCSFLSIETNCSAKDPNRSGRPDGEVTIRFRVDDPDTATVSAYLSFVSGDESGPCCLAGTLAAVPTNTEIEATWLSARDLPDERREGVVLRLYARDGHSVSATVECAEPFLLNNANVGDGSGSVPAESSHYWMRGRLRKRIPGVLIPDAKAATGDDGKTVPRIPPEPARSGVPVGEGYFDWGDYWSGRLPANELPEVVWSADKLDYRLPERALRPRNRLYDGYEDASDGRSESESLDLVHESEFKSLYPKGEFHPVFGREGLDRAEPYLYLDPPDYGREIRHRAPKILRAGALGVYHDGMILEGDPNRAYGGVADDAGNVSYPPGIREMAESPLWKLFYLLDRIYTPEELREKSRGALPADHGTVAVGPADSRCLDEKSKRYWYLAKYPLLLKWPVVARRGGNDAFAWEIDGERTPVSSVLPDGAESVAVASKDDFETLRPLLERLFPTRHFQEAKASDLVETPFGHRLAVYSRIGAEFRRIRLLNPPNSVNSLFSLDSDERIVTSERCDGMADGFAYRTERASVGKREVVFDLPGDTEEWIGRDGEENASEPLLTCDPVHVNRHGCHYKYTPARYRESGRVFVRKYELVPVYPGDSGEPMRSLLPGESGPAPSRGRCAFVLERMGRSSLGEELFVRKALPGPGGVPAIKRKVRFRNGAGRIAAENGWWPAGGDPEDPSQCVSHGDWDAESSCYGRRLDCKSLLEKTRMRQCFHAEYVPLEEAWEKPLVQEFFNGGQKASRTQSGRLHASLGFREFQYLLGAYHAGEGDGFVSTATGEPGRSSRRYDENWRELSCPDGVSVDPGYVVPGGRVSTFDKVGLVPEHAVGTPFRIDSEGVWAGRLIPMGNGLVHRIETGAALSAPWHSETNDFRVLLPSTSKQEIPPGGGAKAEGLDYRIAGRQPVESRPYVSAYPREEHPAYAARPDAVYAWDRPLRICASAEALREMLPWRVIYLQTEWNTYNLIHWEGSQQGDLSAALDCAEVVDGVTSSEWLPVKTRRGVWNESAGMFAIPFGDGVQSDYIDTLNGGMVRSKPDGMRELVPFRSGATYRFRVRGITSDGSLVGGNAPSTPFAFDLEAYSPPVVTGVSYDAWNARLEIRFRFDDRLGREYDVTDCLYACYDEGSASPPDSAFQFLGTGRLSGRLEGLSSNREGGETPPGSVIEHTVYLPIDALEGWRGRPFRIRLEAVPSGDREGLAAPVFDFKLWMNGLLRRAEKLIDDNAGWKNPWVRKNIVSTDADGNGISEEKWVRLPAGREAEVPGRLGLLHAERREIEDEFDRWYAENAGFRSASICAKVAYAQAVGSLDQAESACAEAFVAFAGLEEDYAAYSLERSEVGVDGSVNAPERSILVRRFAEGRAEYALYRANRLHLHLGDLPGFAPKTGAEFVDTGDLDRAEFVEARSDEFAGWLSNPIDATGEAISPEWLDCEDDRNYLFIAHDPALRNAFLSSNAGRSAAYRWWLENTSTCGRTRSERLSEIASEEETARQELALGYRMRNRLESRFRSRLVSQGYFCNGWRNGMPFLADGTPNAVFRFRVENRPADGTVAESYERAEEGDGMPVEVPLMGYDTRWEVYCRFQLDFSDAFDSQDGNRPLRDVLWQESALSGDAEVAGEEGMSRIHAGIEAEGGMAALPGESYGGTDGVETPKTPYTYRLSARYAIPLKELPGRLPGDEVPADRDGFEQLYFWRVLPYNLLERPVMQREWTRLLFLRSEDGMCHARFRTAFFRSPAEGRLASESNAFGTAYHPFLWAADGELDTPRWVVDSALSMGAGGSATAVAGDSWQTNYFPGTSGDGFPTAVVGNPLAGAYQRRISEGECVFPTDRPRVREDGRLSFAEDADGSFDACWLPWSPVRGRMCVVRDGEALVYRGVCAKPIDAEGNRGLVLCMATSPVTWGEVAMLFPASTMDSPESVLPGAVSFDEPFLRRDGGEWRLYFAAKMRDGARQVLLARSGDLSEWSAPEAVSLDVAELSDIAVYPSDGGGFVLYGVRTTAIGGLTRLCRLSSADGVSFSGLEELYAETGQLSRPTAAGGRLYFGLRRFGRDAVYSLDLADASGDPVPRLEFENASEPFALEDLDHGDPVVRLFHSEERHPFAFKPEYTERTTSRGTVKKVVSGHSLERIAEISEPVMLTHILETRRWRSVPVEKILDSEGLEVRTGLSSRDGTPLADGEYELSFRADRLPEAVRIPMYMPACAETIRAEGEWISRADCAEAGAELQPERLSPDKSFVSMAEYISREGLDFDGWLASAHPGAEPTDDLRREFLLREGRFQDWLKEGAGGPGCWRMLPGTKRLRYWGDGRK